MGTADQQKRYVYRSDKKTKFSRKKKRRSFIRSICLVFLIKKKQIKDVTNLLILPVNLHLLLSTNKSVSKKIP